MQSSRRPESAPASVLLALCAACGGGGGGGGGPAHTIGFAAPSFDVDEDGGTVAVVLALQGPAGSSLGEPASVTVSDAGSGTATSGVDYAGFAPVTVTFPAGTAVGAELEVELTPIGDDLVEGAPETVVLALSGVQGSGLAAHAAASVQLVDGETAVLRFTSASQLTPDEASTQHVATVQLVLPGGCVLAVPVGADVIDDGVGTASSGADYAAVATTRVEFAAGSPGGSTQTVAVSVLDDALVEGDEGVRLALSAPDPGAKVGATASHQIVIHDDETPSGQFLHVSQGPNGTEYPLAGGSPVGLGMQGVGDGPNAGTLVRVSNLGNVAFGVAAPLLAGLHPEDFSVVLESAPLPGAPGDARDPQFVLAPDAPAPVGARLAAPQGLAFELDAALLEGLALASEVTLHGFPLPGRADGTLALARVALPFSADARLVVDGVEQPGGPQALLAGLTLWSGAVLETPGSRVFLALSPTSAQGFVEFPGSPERLVHVVTEVPAVAGGAPARVRVLEDAGLEALGVLPPPRACAEAREVPGASGLPGPDGGAPSLGGEPPSEALHIVNCRVAIETDYQLYQRFGSTGALSTYVASLMAAVSERYVTDVQAQLSVSYLGVYTTPADPWTSQDGGGDAGDLLDEFQDAWTGSGWPAAAALAHFVSGANLGGGVAYLNVLCNPSFGFGVSGNVVGNINWGAWSGASASFTWDFVVVAHELGHNFGAGHSHGYCPPLDQCYTNCSGTTVCGSGTLMSYCHLCAGGMNNIELLFHPHIANIMRANVNSSCLGWSVLDGGDHVQYLVRFEPKSQSGVRTAELRFPHGAPNHPTPLALELSGLAQP